MHRPLCRPRRRRDFSVIHGPLAHEILRSVYILEGTKPRVANPRVGSSTGFGGPGGGYGGPGGIFFLVVSVMALPLLLLLSRNHRQDHQNHHQDHQNQYQNPLGG